MGGMILLVVYIFVLVLGAIEGGYFFVNLQVILQLTQAVWKRRTVMTGSAQ